MNQEQELGISGFWRRLGAFFIDSIMLGIVGLILGIFFGDYFAQFGGWGRAIGFPIAAMYFTIMNSSLSNGQTLGKKVLNIQVINKDGKLLSPIQSFFRYSILGAPYFLNGAQFSEEILSSILGYFLSFAVFGMGLSIVYLFIFNRRTRQSLHDIIMGTCVVYSGAKDKLETKSIWVVHYAVCAILLFALALAPLFNGNLAKSDFFSALSETRSEILSLPEVVSANINDGKSTFTSFTKDKTTTTYYISTNVMLLTDQIEDEDVAVKIAKIILEQHPEAHKRNIIQVILTYGYDIGIASKWRNNKYSFSPSEWGNKIKNQSNQKLNLTELSLGFHCKLGHAAG